MSEYELHVCGDCAAFGTHIDGTESDDDGACRRHPPSVISLGDGIFSTVYPSVNSENWCLEWTRKVDE